jgi:hypothetical protein
MANAVVGGAMRDALAGKDFVTDVPMVDRRRDRSLANRLGVV